MLGKKHLPYLFAGLLLALSFFFLTSFFLPSETIIAKALDHGDPAICNVIEKQDEREFCYWSVAVNLQDSTICSMIAKRETKESCYNDLRPSP